jgi:hypothetical protein
LAGHKKNMGQTIEEKSGLTHYSQSDKRTTIALQKNTRKRLADSRAPGQCYDGFISELIDYWERYRIGSSLCGPGKPIRQNAER